MTKSDQSEIITTTFDPERSLPILPVRDTVLFPHAVLPLSVGRDSSVQLINSLGEDKTIVVVSAAKFGPSRVMSLSGCSFVLRLVAVGHGTFRFLQLLLSSAWTTLLLL